MPDLSSRSREKGSVPINALEQMLCSPECAVQCSVPLCVDNPPHAAFHLQSWILPPSTTLAKYACAWHPTWVAVCTISSVTGSRMQ